MELNSIAWVEGQYYRPRIDDKLIQEHSEGVICLSACLAGEILQNLLDNRYEEARRRVLWFKSVFGDRYYLELQDHGLEEQKRTNPLLVRLAHECGVPLVCTNDIHYIEQADAQAQEVLLCIGTGSKLKEEGHFRFPCQEFYFKTPQQMKELFSWCPEAIENTRKVAERCNLEIRFPGPLLPIFQPPKDFRQEPRYQEFMDLVQNSEEYRKFVSPEVDEKMNPQSRLQADYLILLSYQGLVRRYGEEKAKEYRARMNHELGVIIKMDFQGYFLIVRDYIYWAKTHGIPVGPGRGSGAGSIVVLPHDREVPGATVIDIPAGVYATMYHYAMPYDLAGERRLLAWMAERGLEPEGDAIDRCLFDTVFHTEEHAADFSRVEIKVRTA